MFVREDDTAVQSGCEELPCRRRVTTGTSQESLVFFSRCIENGCKVRNPPAQKPGLDRLDGPPPSLSFAGG
jgi:hypothetical protein